MPAVMTRGASAGVASLPDHLRRTRQGQHLPMEQARPRLYIIGLETAFTNQALLLLPNESPLIARTLFLHNWTFCAFRSAGGHVGS